MGDDTDHAPDETADQVAAARRAARRRMLDDVFGEVLPEVTRDEIDGGQSRAVDLDQWYRDNRPPHHD